MWSLGHSVLLVAGMLLQSGGIQLSAADVFNGLNGASPLRYGYLTDSLVAIQYPILARQQLCCLILSQLRL